MLERAIGARLRALRVRLRPAPAGSRFLATTRPGARPLFDAQTPMTAADEREYLERSTILGYVGDRMNQPDEGPEIVSEPGVALGVQGDARVVDALEDVTIDYAQAIASGETIRIIEERL